MNDSRKTVLVVDDTAEQIALMSGILNSHYRVEAAKDGERALKIAATEPQPDVILLDLLMPGMTGREVLWHLCSDPMTFEIPVIIVSSAGVEALGEDLKGSYYAALQKPINPEALLETVAKALSP
ncbi:response regulator receiver modulated metal dependent phosphohydrolase [Luminiphilus syltensis NOR5-1B]|uniref:Response regulator receiver modulated metal dependent phosphohydrolase n=1 Tax=Luminiphilus syltensis NOR5-1B TaxID=565045 RepID=B8KTG5_9GAMM|nr:response regulator [Luminiphilus syltensis]EED35927.1 response regulator receiver modulated metal dependent phosphohydrolase [Luminiphilus syltensis NOR5-1B]